MLQTKDTKAKTVKLQEYLESKYRDNSDFVIVNNNVYSKTSISFATLSGINEIQKIKAVYFLSDNSKPYKLGYKVGICLTQI